VTYFTPFKKSIVGIPLPKKFTFPFYYEPHLLAKIASEELQEYLDFSSIFKRRLGLLNNTHEIGKMFGVLVVKNSNGKLGYLSAFSGNLPNQSDLMHFVPPVYDILQMDGFFSKENAALIALSNDITTLEMDSHYITLQKIVAENNKIAENIISVEKEKLKKRKLQRKLRKKNASPFTESLQIQLHNESLHDTFYLRELICYYEDKFISLQEKLNALHLKITRLKSLRNSKSNALHRNIFSQYHFLNSDGKTKSLLSIFKDLNLEAPAGTGDCAAPKLLQFAFLNGLTPIAMAEFWWGKSGNAAIRKHGVFYPSCKGKCEPVLSYMLNGLVLDENPLLKNLAKDKKIEFIFEDEQMLVINKPTELLSVPGKSISDSVFSRLKEIYPESEKHLIIHRLDMSTSGIMLIAKTKKAHQFLQNQFINRSITKRYIALLDGLILNNNGEINLPLRVDLDDRPRQLVCFKHGKPAKTMWNVLGIQDQKTRIEFTPITGRTHQLRVHAAHVLGLNTAIVGDDLYGNKADRLYLHAEYIRFTHPNKKVMEFCIAPNF